MNSYVRDITGQQYGDLTAIKFVYKYYGKGRTAVWLWQCTCGNQFERPLQSVRGSALKGGTPSCPDCRRRGKYLPKCVASKNQVVAQYKSNAKRRGYSFRLSDLELDILFTSNCYYCDSRPQNNKNSFIYQGIDRVDNTKNYTIENCVPCCMICNRAKNNLPFDEFISWIINL